jgi:hypothetical protein
LKFVRKKPKSPPRLTDEEELHMFFVTWFLSLVFRIPLVSWLLSFLSLFLSLIKTLAQKFPWVYARTYRPYVYGQPVLKIIRSKEDPAGRQPELVLGQNCYRGGRTIPAKEAPQSSWEWREE